MDHREANRAGHPSACTCVACVKRRLREQRKSERNFSGNVYETAARRAANLANSRLVRSRRRNERESVAVSRFVRGVLKLCLNLTILVGLVLLIRGGYQLFTVHSEDPLWDSTLMILGFVAWVLVIKLSKSRSGYYWLRYKGTKPSFKLTTFSVIAVLLVFAFAGVQPVSTYKDNFVGGCAVVQPETEFVPESTPTPVPESAPVSTPKTDFDKVTDGLTSPELVASYMEENVSYDREKYERFMAGEEWGWDTAEEVFYGKKTHCGGYAIFALYCLLKNGYEYDNFEDNRDNAAVMLGCWNSNVPNGRDVHTVLLYIEGGLFYTIDVYRIRGPFNDIEEAATASLSTWTTCYFYNAEIRVTKTVERGVEVLGGVGDVERLVFDLINTEREKSGLKVTKWDDELYGLSKRHTEAVADSGYLFHSPTGANIAENCWGGYGYSRYSGEGLAEAIVESWMSSPLHRAWLLHGPIRHSVVSIVVTEGGQYASWTFWVREVGKGPGLIRKIVREWENSGSDLDWVPWLRSKGYL